MFLLIASANVGSLALVRLMQRDQELAIRKALGAARSRVISQLVIESTLLAAVACVLGVAGALGIRWFLTAFGPYRTDIFAHLPFDTRVFAFAGVLLVCTVLVFGLLPAIRMSDFRVSERLAAGQISIAGKRHNLHLLSLVAACEIAVVIALSSSAALMLKSFWNMRYKELGFEARHAIGATLNLNTRRYRDKARQFSFIDRLLDRVAAIPGIESAAITAASEIPPGEGHATNVVKIEGRPLAVDSRRKALMRPQAVSAAYFEVLHIPLMAGRFLRDTDRRGSLPVVVVNHQFAHRYFPHESALGHRLETGETENTLYTIVGVVGDVKTSGLATAPEPVVYTPYDQTDGQRLRGLGIVMQSSLPMASIAPEFRNVVKSIDPEQPIATMETIDGRLNASVSRPRFTAHVLFFFAFAGILLAMIGVYGVIACRVRSHVREIAVRQAVGATPWDVLVHILGHGVRFIFPGVAAGVAVALMANRLISSLLFEVKPEDPTSLALVCAGITTIAFCAVFVPALRVSRLDPLLSLREK